MSTHASNQFRFERLSLKVEPTVFIGSVILWLILSAVGTLLLNMPLAQAAVLAAVATLLHWLGDVLHQMGHALAAARTGHPMSGIRFWWLLSDSVYPTNEPEIPRSLHVQRALGGPTGSMVITIIAIFPVFLIPVGTPAWWLALFFFLDNLLTFSVGALLPFGFTDGSTLIRLYSAKE